MGPKRGPGRRESAFWGPVEVSGGSFWSKNRFETDSTHTKFLLVWLFWNTKTVPNSFHSNEILGGFVTSTGSECFRGSGSGWETERTRFRLVTRVRSSFIVHRSSFIARRHV